LFPDNAGQEGYTMKRRGSRSKRIRFALYAAVAIAGPMALPAQTFTTVHVFTGTDGAYPEAALVQGIDGNLYGTTANGGANNSGTFFKINPAGKLTVPYSFCSQSNCTDGAGPVAALVQAANGTFYGTTRGGGANGSGTIFKITPSGTLTTLYSFCSQSNCADGGTPDAGLVRAFDGDFYGTTSSGSASGNFGTIFKIAASGALTTLYSFCAKANCADGYSPEAGLVQAPDGDFYGTTLYGGASDNCLSSDGISAVSCGTVFKITSSGMLTTLYSFCSESDCTDGGNPAAGLVQA
jgi:uncharacterized repeat protein (TIGR03803 family)